MKRSSLSFGEKSMRVLGALTVGLAALTTVPLSPADAAPVTCGGVVWQDFDGDGERLENYGHISPEYSAIVDSGVSAITVEVTDSNGDVFTSQTDANGVWSVTVDAVNFPVRVNVSDLPPNWSAGPVGPDSGSLDQFIASPADCAAPFDGTGASANASIAVPGPFCENRPDFVTSCFLFGNVSGHDSMAAVVTLIDGAVDNGATTGTGWQDDPYVVEATLGEVGSIYGLDVRPQDGSFYGASFVKRHARLGSTANPTTIYRISGGSGTPWFTTDPGAADPHTANADGGWLNDFGTFDDVGTTGLGDIELSPDGNTLYTIDLGSRELVSVPINLDGSANTAGVTRTAITAGSLGVASSCAADDVRPFGLGFTQYGTLLVGSVCSAASTVDAASLPIDEVTGDPLNAGAPSPFASRPTAAVYTFDGSSFSLLVDVPLPAVTRGTQNGVTDPSDANYFRSTTDWRPWVSRPPFATDFSGWPAEGMTYAQPILSDIEVDGEDLIIGVMDRWAHQMGPNSFYEDWDNRNGGQPFSLGQPISSGDILRAVANGSGGYSFPTAGPDYFYHGDNYWTVHAETALGSSEQIPGRPYVVTNSFDPLDASSTWQSGGLEWFANTNQGSLSEGDHIRGYRLYDGRAGLATGTLEKAAGIGDLQAICAPIIEVGNYLWLDADLDGLADPEENPLPGVAMELVDGSGTVIDATTSGTDGRYLFTGLDAGLNYVIRVAASNYASGGIFGSTGTHAGKVATIVDAGTSDGYDSDAVAIAGLPSIAFTASVTDHTMDIGFVDGLRLGNTVWLDSDGNGSQNGSEPGIAGVEMQLWTADAAGIALAQVGTETTGPTGRYLFEGLVPGDYLVAIADTQQASSQPLAGLTSTTGNGTAPDPDDDVDLDDNGDPETGFAARSAAVTLASGSEPLAEAGEGGFTDANSNLSIDFGFTALLRLGNLVWFDADNDGIADIGEAPIVGVEVQLWTADAAGEPVSLLATDTTDSSGHYLFEGLKAGDYVVAIADTQASAGQPLAGLASSTGNDPSPDPDNGLDNDDNGTSAAGFAALSSAVTLDLSTPTSESDGLTGAADEDGSWVDAMSDLSVDFGFYGPLRLGNTVWLDSDGNGYQNGTEPGIAGVEIQLWTVDAAGMPVAQVATETTDSDGRYLFEGLRAGDYIVAIADTQLAAGQPLESLGSTTGNGVAPDPDNDADLDDNGDPTPGFAAISLPVTLEIGGEPSGEVAEGGWIDNDSNLSVDFGFVGALRLGNLVFEDLDDDGIADAGEPAIAGVEVQLWTVDATGNPLAQIAVDTTDSNGIYGFDGLAPGDYVVAIADTQQAVGSPLEGFTSADGNGAAPDPDNDSDNDDNGDAAPGFASISAPVTLTSLLESTLEPEEDGLYADVDSNLTVDLGFKRSYRIGNLVWLDADNDGVADPGEAPIAGVEVQLWSADAAGNRVAVVATTTTNASGHYWFENLAAGEYIVAIADSEQATGGPLAGTTSSLDPASDPDDGIDNDDDGETAAGFAAISAAVTLDAASPSGETNGLTGSAAEDGSWTDSTSDLTVDFGFVGALRLGNTVWLDSDGNGSQNDGEPGIAGVEVQLWSTDAAGNPASHIANATTDNSGIYLFESLVSGSYVVAIANSEQGAGEPLAGLGSTTGNGIAPDPDDDVDLDDNGDPETGFAAISAAVTLNGGTEPIVEAAEGGWIDADSNLSVDFGFVPGLELGNLVWIDTNNNGVIDPSEPTVAGVVLELRDSTGSLLATTTTDPAGNYLFADLGPGDYSVHIPAHQFAQGAPLAGWHISTGAGSSADPDDDVDANNDGRPSLARLDGVSSGVVTLSNGDEPLNEADESPSGLADGSSNLSVDFGFYQVSLGDQVWFDDDNDGVRDQGEAPAAGVTLLLLNGNGDPVLGPDGLPLTQVTNSNGNYTFTGLAEGTYIVEVPGSNFGVGGPLAGVVTSTGNDSNGSAPDPDDDVESDDNGDFIIGGGAKSKPVTIIAGSEPGIVLNPTIDFGFTPAAGLGNRVWFDEDSDGIQDDGEKGVPGVVVTVTDSRSGKVVGVVTTDSAGLWIVRGLPPGEYAVSFADPLNRTFTVRDVGGNDGLDSDVASDGTAGAVVLSAGELDLSTDAGIVPVVSTTNIAFTGTSLSSWLAGVGSALVLGGAMLVLLIRRRNNADATSAT